MKKQIITLIILLVLITSCSPEPKGKCGDGICDPIEKNLGKLDNKKIGILGLAFKENTDDIRESVSIRLIDSLLKKKCKIIAHDPKAIGNTKKKFKEKIEYCDRYENIFNSSDCAILMTPWESYKKISPNMIKKLNSKIFVDTRRMLKINDKNINVIYLGIGI